MHWWMTLLVTIRKSQKLFLQIQVLFQVPKICCFNRPFVVAWNIPYLAQKMDSKYGMILPWNGWIINVGIISLHWVFKSPVSPDASTPFAMCISYTFHIPANFPIEFPWDVCITSKSPHSSQVFSYFFSDPTLLHVSPGFFRCRSLIFPIFPGWTAQFPLPACRSTVAKPLRSVQRRCARSFGGSSVKGMDTASEAEVRSNPRDHHGWYTYICRYVDLQLHVNIWIW